MVSATSIVGAVDNLAAGETRRALTRELDALLALPDEAIDVGHVAFLDRIYRMPEHLRPELPATVRSQPLERAVELGWDGTGPVVAQELLNLRLDAGRRSLEAAPTTTRAALDHELRAIVARPNVEVTQDDLQRISVIARVREDLRPSLLQVEGPWPAVSFEQLGVWKRDPADSIQNFRLDQLRVAIEREAMVADPTVTRDSVTRELVDLIATPPHELDEPMLRRMGLLARMPDHLGPTLPPPADPRLRFQDLGMRPLHPNTDADAARVHAAARTHILGQVEADILVDTVRDRVARGGAVDRSIVDAIIERGASLDDVGLTPHVLRDRALSALVGTSPARPRAIGEQLALVRAAFEDAPAVAGAQATLRAEVFELIDRNAARIGGLRTDTYKAHPDYAEIGQLTEHGRLLNALAADASPSTLDSARAGADLLSW